MTKKQTAHNTANDHEIIIKKYANRRLYNTSSSSYITLEDLAQMVRDEEDFQVIDAKSGEDLTQSVLIQIIVDEEVKGENMLPVSFLRQLIPLYGDNMQWMVPKYLEQVMANFSNNQEKVRHYMDETFGPFSPLGQMERMKKKNAEIVENAMRMFSPFPNVGEGSPVEEEPDDIQAQLDKLKSELDTIKNKKS